MTEKQLAVGRQQPIEPVLPPEIGAQIRTMRITSMVSLVMLILAGMLIVVAIACAAYGRWTVAGVFFALFLVPAAALVLIRCFYRRKAAYTLHQIPCAPLELRRLSAVFHAEAYNETSCGAVLSRNGTQFTIQMYQTTHCDAAFRKRMRKALRGHSQDAQISIRESGKYAKIHLILCDSLDQEVLETLPMVARRNLNRSEILFHLIVCRGEKQLYFIGILDDLDILQVKRYAAFCGIVAQIAAIDTGDGSVCRGNG